MADARRQLDPGLHDRHVLVTDAEIDALVYELYGLTTEEVAIVEDRSNKRRLEQ